MAIKNLSTSATTVKTMYELMPSDSWTLDKCVLYGNYDNASIVQTEILFDKYFSYLSQYLIELDVDKKYYYQPGLFAQDYYGDSALDFVVLYFAKMTSLFEFNKPKITVFDYAHIQDLNKIFTAYKNIVTDNKQNPPTYLSSDVSDISTHAKYIQD